MGENLGLMALKCSFQAFWLHPEKRVVVIIHSLQLKLIYMLHEQIKLQVKSSVRAMTRLIN